MNSDTCQPLKRGWPAQQPRREAERDARCQAVAFGHCAMQQGVGQRVVAQQTRLGAGYLGLLGTSLAYRLLDGPPFGPSLSSQQPTIAEPGRRLHACRGRGRQRGGGAGGLPGTGPPRGREPPPSLPAALEIGQPADDPRPALAQSGGRLGHGSQRTGQRDRRPLALHPGRPRPCQRLPGGLAAGPRRVRRNDDQCPTRVVPGAWSRRWC